MTIDIIIKPSHLSSKKYDAIIDGKKTIPFGAKGMSDYTKHKDDERKERYIDRHKKNENWNDPKTAGFYSKNILWNKKTITESIRDTNNRFKNINIKMKQFKEILIYNNKKNTQQGYIVRTVPHTI